MFDGKKTPTIRNLRLQKVLLIGIAGLIGCGVIASYLNFHNQVSQYTQSVAYREAQEASKEYKVKLMRRNQQLFSTDEPEPTTTRKPDD